MPTRTFHRDELTAIGVPDAKSATQEFAAEVLDDTFAHEVRWANVYSMIFKAPDDARHWRVEHYVGKGEFPDDHDTWDDETDILATEVEHRERTVFEWCAVSDKDDARRGGITLHTEPVYTLNCNECDYSADEEGDGQILFDSEKHATEWAVGFGWATPDPASGGKFLCVGCREEKDAQDMQRQEVSAAILDALPGL